MSEKQDFVVQYLKDIRAGLRRPFHETIVKWLVVDPSKADPVGKAVEKRVLAYIDARDVAMRLDAVVGFQNWQTHYTSNEGGATCELAIYLPQYDAEEDSIYWVWIDKSDGAGNTEVEAVKGAHSEAFKRAAAQWGVGQYLYLLGENIVSASRGKNGLSYSFNIPSLPEFARPDTYDESDLYRIQVAKQTGRDVVVTATIQLPDTTPVQHVVNKYSKEEIESTMLNIPPHLLSKTIGQAMAEFNPAFVIKYLAGYTPSKDNRTFSPATDAEKDIMEKARCYYEYYLAE